MKRKKPKRESEDSSSSKKGFEIHIISYGNRGIKDSPFDLARPEKNEERAEGEVSALL